MIRATLRNVSGRLGRPDFVWSPEDRRTHARWCGGVLIFYAGIGLFVLALIAIKLIAA
jgi:hypothetical protein